MNDNISITECNNGEWIVNLEYTHKGIGYAISECCKIKNIPLAIKKVKNKYRECIKICQAEIDEEISKTIGTDINLNANILNIFRGNSGPAKDTQNLFDTSINKLTEKDNLDTALVENNNKILSEKLYNEIKRTMIDNYYNPSFGSGESGYKLMMSRRGTATDTFNKNVEEKYLSELKRRGMK